jgi:hypothetical protein
MTQARRSPRSHSLPPSGIHPARRRGIDRRATALSAELPQAPQVFTTKTPRHEEGLLNAPPPERRRNCNISNQRRSARMPISTQGSPYLCVSVVSFRGGKCCATAQSGARLRATPSRQPEASRYGDRPTQPSRPSETAPPSCPRHEPTSGRAWTRRSATRGAA